METKLSSVDSLLEQAGLLSTSLKPAASVQENDSLTSSFSSGRAGSITDLDADLLGVKLDDCSRYFKKEIMGFFLDSKAKLTYEGRALAEAEQRKGASQLAESQARLEAVKQELHHERQISARSDALLNRVTASYATARHYAHRNHLVALAMFGWHSFARQQKAMRQHLRQAVKHYDGRKLQGQVFLHWKRWCNLEGRSNRQEVLNRKMQAAKEAAWAEAGLVIHDLKAALVGANEQLSQERAARDQLEEDMKQSFMRSVCAINLEAMSVMKRGMPPGGMNPVPVKVAVKDKPASPMTQQHMQPDAAKPAVAALNRVKGEDTSDQAQHAKQDVQEGLSSIEEGPEDVPSSNIHHPILGMRSPLHRLTSQGITAAAAQAPSFAPVRQSSAVNFNASLGGWDGPARPTSAKPTHKVAAAMSSVTLAQPHALQSLKAVITPSLPQQAGGMPQAIPGSDQQTQDLRPRSSDGILQRITVDRGPVTGQTLPFNVTSDS
ncbi:hypothetical protein ABBQ32_008261 [Trebouxia sp. C0010 RCD-2024]